MNRQRLFNGLVIITLMLLTLWSDTPISAWAASQPAPLTISSQTLVIQPAWIELTPVGSPPDPVYERKHIHYDAANNLLIVFFPGHPPYNPNPPANGNEVWVLTNANGLGGTPVWSKLQPTGTPPFSNGLESVVYDAANNRLIVYGGCWATCSPALSEVFVLTNANGLGGTPAWSQVSVTNPQARADHSAVYDSANNLLITFGGFFAFPGTEQNDARILSQANGLTSPATWSTLSPTGGSPGDRISPTAIYDPTSNRMTIFGGENTNPTSQYNDVWVLVNANGLGGTPGWVQLTPSGTLPSPRLNHSAVYDAVNNRLIIFGGLKRATGSFDDWIHLGDLWQLSHANGLGGTPAWTQLSPTGTPPGPRFYHTAAFDAANQRMIVLGGRDETDAPSNRVWVLALPPPAIIYLPLIFKSEPLTHLYVQSINTGGINPFEVRDPNKGDALLLRCVIGNNVTQFCGSFPAIGTYKVVAYPANCPPKAAIFNDALPGATVTRVVICQ